MTLSDSVASTHRPPRVTLLAVVVGAALLGTAAAYRLSQGGLVPALSLLPYLGLLWLVWWLSRGNVPVLVLVAYLIAPFPADNLLPQVFIFAADDYGLRVRDLVFLADLVLIAALLAVRPPWPKERLLRLWLVCLALLAVVPVVVGLVAGVGQSVPALLQGATMPLRGIGVLLLFVGWARSRGWDDTLRSTVRTVVLCGAVVAVAEIALKILAGGELNAVLAGYPIAVDGRPALPGWGNNILANFFCTCLAALVFLRHRLAWRTRWVALLSVLLLVGLAYTEVRIAMLLALLVVETPLVLHVVRRTWIRRGGLLAVGAGALVAAVLAVGSVVVLFYLNPRFTTITPAFLEQRLPTFGATELVLGTAAETDLGGASISTRTALLRTAVDVWLRSPVVGTGWNGWGWAKQDATPPQAVGVDPHNGFTWLLADAGVLGVVLLYLPLAVQMVRRWDLWWLWAVPLCATALEMVNPNLRNGHFAALVWAFVALGFAAAGPADRYGIGRWLRESLGWIRGGAPPGAAPTREREKEPAPV